MTFITRHFTLILTTGTELVFLQSSILELQGLLGGKKMSFSVIIFVKSKSEERWRKVQSIATYMMQLIIYIINQVNSRKK